MNELIINLTALFQLPPVASFPYVVAAVFMLTSSHYTFPLIMRGRGSVLQWLFIFATGLLCLSRALVLIYPSIYQLLLYLSRFPLILAAFSAGFILCLVMAKVSR
ncbi:MAG TPA: hypothetical protein VLL52_22500 [Anaerolineae bacterium]|nr:hypothetical protein [Anaerolineae bacterium]